MHENTCTFSNLHRGFLDIYVFAKNKIILTENNLTKLYFEEFTEEILVRRHASKNNENTKTIHKQLNAFYFDLKQT